MLPRPAFVWLFALTLFFGNLLNSHAAGEIGVCASAPPGLIHWYRAEGDPNDSMGTRHAILQNGTSFGPGKVGQAFQLDGANDYVDLGNWFDLQVFTIAMWVKAGASQQTYADIMDNNHTDYRSWVIQYDNTGLQFHWGIGQRGAISFSLTPDTWQFLVVSYDANHLGRLYLDGDLKGSFQGNGPIPYDGSQFLRLSAWGGGGRFFNGEIDEVDVYDRALAQAEVLSLFQAGSAGKCVNCDPTPDGIASWWNFEGNGNDSVGSKTVTLKNGAVFGAGKAGQGLQLDGVDDYAEAPADSQWRFGTNDFTIELWAKFNSLKDSSLGYPAAVFAGCDDGAGAQNKWMFTLGGGTLNFHINSPTMGVKFLALAPFEPVFGQWYHLAITRDAAGYRIFKNGTQIGVEANSDPVPDPSAPLTIGQAEGLGFMDGAIDELTIYRRALSVDEIAGIFAAGEAGKCGPNSGLPDLQITSVAAPDFALPGNSFEISVTVTNSGTALAQGNWLNGLYFSSDPVLSDDDLFVGDAIFPSALAPGASMVITQTVTAPLMAGEFFLIAAADSDNRVSEEKEANNWLAATTTIIVPAGLHLALSSGVLNEDDTNQIIRATISRSGAAATPLTVNLTATPQGQIVMPPQVTIPGGESSATFTIWAVSDDLPEGSQTISLTAQATDITDAHASLAVTDADEPHLFLEIPAQTLMEGSSVTGIVRRDFVTT